MDVTQFLAFARKRVQAENWEEVVTPAGPARCRTHTQGNLTYACLRLGEVGNGATFLITETVRQCDDGKIIWGNLDYVQLASGFSSEQLEEALNRIHQAESSESVRGPLSYSDEQGLSYLTSGGESDKFSGAEVLLQGGQVLCQTNYVGGRLC